MIMGEETFPFDAAELLDNEEDVLWFLDEAKRLGKEHNCPEFIAHALDVAERARQRWQHQNTPGVVNGV